MQLKKYVPEILAALSTTGARRPQNTAVGNANRFMESAIMPQTKSSTPANSTVPIHCFNDAKTTPVLSPTSKHFKVTKLNLIQYNDNH